MDHYPLNIKFLKQKIFSPKSLINFKNSKKISLSQNPWCSHNKQKNLPWAQYAPMVNRVNRGGMADLPFLRTLLAICQMSWEPSFWEVMDSCFFSICKYGNFKNPFTGITSLPELHRFRRFIVLVQMKKVISMNYGRSSWKSWRWVRLDLVFTMSNRYRWAEWENLIYVRWRKWRRRWLIEEKEVRHCVKPVENKSKNLHSFLEISPVEKEVFPLQKTARPCIWVTEYFWIKWR